MEEAYLTDPTEFAFIRAVRGIAHPPSPALMEETSEVEDRDEITERAAQAIVDARNIVSYERKRRGLPTADQVVTEGLRNRGYEVPDHGNALWHKLLSIANALAQANPAYWGVDDPQQEWYCSECRTVLPRSDFTKSEYRCDDCFDSKEG